MSKELKDAIVRPNRTMRVPRDVYDKLAEQRRELSGEGPLMTFGELLEQYCAVGDLLIKGQEAYAVDGRIFESLPEARGHAIVESVKLNRGVSHPEILLRMGKDELFK